ncbi:MAG: hypothetical protein DMG41_26495 [Acidobacteria bacterium]|nr:MAG: hypothetical protein DMG42_28025 [Acidobacteriota bacterium]PYT84733.1 MAG: hypothetical protein DMG41_26495 [Acidobacteriota bacterium]
MKREAKFAYQRWESGAAPLALRNWIGSRPKRFWPRHKLDLPLYGIALEANQGLFDSSESANQK